MHHALEIEEILLNIFHYSGCPPGLSAADQRKTATPDLAALARTCRAFKEPALDVLWSVIFDLSPLARCLPGASHPLPPANSYSFNRPLMQTDWDILQSYTRRIRSIQKFKFGLDRKSIKILSNPPTSGPLFPRLRELHCTYTKKTMPLLHLPLPSLVSLYVEFGSLKLFQNSLHSFPRCSPSIGKLWISMREPRGMVNKMEPNYICRWQSLWSVHCPGVTLDVDDLVHLSRIPALTRLGFTPSTTLQAPESPLFFSNLHDLTLYPHSLDPVSHLLSWIRLVAMTYFVVFFGNCPSRQSLSFFMASVQTSGAGHTVRSMLLMQSTPPPSDIPRSEALLLGLEDLRPLMAFRNIRDIVLNMECNVRLTNRDVLTLASSWPRLQHLQINEDWGWNSQGGLTPGGLLRLLQTCRSLSHIAILLDTRGYTRFPPSQTPASLGLILPPKFSINVLDSTIEAESVPAIASLFRGLAEACLEFSFIHRNGLYMVEPPNVEEYRECWHDVYVRLWPNQRSEFVDSGAE
ncbi:hypothetical protein L210DRAFT_3452279 [Boletus edulis BED1]|uniref:F-box domain-containing protein n=1 Tax=Boletus edulis BED1 TaxID=1328754 RepID=A0AAD4GBR4_BOLED|nr:hypothetical protein L210DRAFT_3452279 [Boletus edulis BED1]